VKIAPLADQDESEVLRLAAALEQASEHPLAAAIARAAAQRGVGSARLERFESTPGLGVRGEAEGRPLALGSAAWMETLGIDVAPALPIARGLQAQGQTAIFAAIGGRAAGLLAVADPVKATSRQAVADLRAEGVRIVMLSGDSIGTAQAVAREVGIDDVIAGVLPEQKRQVIEQLQAQGRIVAMAGDGINDAPALARAQVGIAMGTGTGVAIESAGVTLIGGDLGGIVRARRLSRITLANIRQNLIFAFGYNALGVPIAAGALYPIAGILLSPMLAAAAMSLSSVCVIANALRLRRARI
jgi:P-type Cu+ transporter